MSSLNPSNLKKIVILGHSGFIGASLFRRLSKKIDPEVLGFSSSLLDLSSDQSVQALASHCDKDTALFFLSAITRDRKNDPIAESKNLKMVSHVIEAVQKNGCRHLVFASSIDVYGHVTEEQLIDEKTPLKPDSSYASYKVNAEELLVKSIADFPLTILRWGGIYGPQDTHPSPIRIFISSILAGKEIPVYGEGKALRDYVFIDDLCRTLEETVLNRVTGTINVVSGRSVSIENILARLENILHKKARIRFTESRGAISSYRFDPVLFKKKFPEIELRDIQTGLEEMCRYYASTGRAELLTA